MLKAPSKTLSLIVCVVFLLQGCGVTFVYNNLSMISPWYVDDFVDLDKAQQVRYQTHLDEIHQWHRSHELPEYHRLLSEILTHLDQPALSADVLDDHFDHLRQRWSLLVEKATPAIVDLAITLSDEQINSLFEALEKANQERVDEAAKISEKERFKQEHESLRGWFGKFSETQLALIDAYVQGKFDDASVTVAAHRAFQRQLATALAERGQDGFDSRFAYLINHPLATEEGRALNAQRQQRAQQRIALYVQLWEQASEKQKQKVRGRLADYIEDIDELMAK